MRDYKPGETFNPPNVTEVHLEALQLCSTKLFDDKLLHSLSRSVEVRAEYRAEYRALALSLVAMVWGKSTGTYVDVHEKYPCDWWQAFKHRWSPGWCKRRWPVKWTHIDVHEEKWRVCPHLDIDARENSRPHLHFLSSEPPCPT